MPNFAVSKTSAKLYRFLLNMNTLPVLHDGVDRSGKAVIKAGQSRAARATGRGEGRRRHPDAAASPSRTRAAQVPLLGDSSGKAQHVPSCSQEIPKESANNLCAFLNYLAEILHNTYNTCLELYLNELCYRFWYVSALRFTADWSANGTGHQVLNIFVTRSLCSVLLGSTTVET